MTQKVELRIIETVIHKTEVTISAEKYAELLKADNYKKTDLISNYMGDSTIEDVYYREPERLTIDGGR